MARKRNEIVVRQPAPERPRPVTESVWIPFLIAMISGALVTLCVVLGWQIWRDAWPTWQVAGLGWCLVTLGVWILQNWHVVLWEAEARTGVDLDRDGHIGDPGGRYVLVNSAPPQEIEQPVDRAHKRLCQFVEAAGKSTATRDLEGQGFTRDEVQMFRGLLLRAGYAQWRSGTSKRDGWLLTRPVGVILAKIE